MTIIPQRCRDCCGAIKLQTIIRIVSTTVLEIALDLIHLGLKVLIVALLFFAYKLIQLVFAFIDHFEDVLDVVVHIYFALKCLLQLREAQVVAEAARLRLTLRRVIGVLTSSTRLALLVSADALGCRFFHYRPIGCSLLLVVLYRERHCLRYLVELIILFVATFAAHSVLTLARLPLNPVVASLFRLSRRR